MSETTSTGPALTVEEIMSKLDALATSDLDLEGQWTAESANARCTEYAELVRLLQADREGECWRCGTHVNESLERVAIDGQGRNDCPESEDGAPHEIDEPS